MFLSQANFTAIVGWDHLANGYNCKMSRTLPLISPYKILEDQIQQGFKQNRNKLWIIEKSEKTSWELVKFTLTDDSFLSLQRDFRFIDKRQTVEPGLEIADLFVHLFYKLNPYCS